MSLSGNQLTRIGTGTALGIKITILPKGITIITTTVIDFGRGIMRAMTRGMR